MSCNHCASSSAGLAAQAGATRDIEANWSAHRDHPQTCPTCRAFLRADGGCTRCERPKNADRSPGLYRKFSCGHINRTPAKPGDSERCAACRKMGVVGQALGELPQQAYTPRKTAVLAPDRWSGELFHNILAAKEAEADLTMVSIAPG